MACLVKDKKSIKIEICKQRNNVQLSIKNQAKEKNTLIIPPDGGWGWVVVAAAFVCTFLVDGIIFSGGMLLKPIQAEFDASDKDVGSVYSLLTGVYLMAGPFASGLTNNYSFNKVTIMGSLISSVGFVLSYFATSIGYLYFTFGVLGGLGFCLINMPAVVVIGFYFEKWRGLATGLALCGSGVGTFVLAPFTDKMTELFGWRVAIIIYGGLMTLGVLCGAVFRPIKPIVLKTDNSKDLPSKLSITREKENCEKSKTPQYTLEIPYNQIHKQKKYLKDNVHRQRRRSEGQRVMNEDTLEMKNCKLNIRIIPNDEDNTTPLLTTSLKDIPNEEVRHRRSSDVMPNTFNRDDMLYIGSLKRLPEYSSQSSLEYHLSVTHTDKKGRTENEKSHYILVFLKHLFTSMFDVSLFQSATFVLLTVSGLLTLMGLMTPYMFVAQRAEDHGIDKTSSVLLVSTIGIANIIGRITCGVITTAPQISTLMIYNIALTVGGIATIFSGLCYHEVYQFAYCIVFGLSIACFVSLRSILAVEYVGLNKLTHCFGLFLLFQGLGALIGTPIAGALNDLTGDYDAAFYVSGGFILLSALICYPVQYIYNWEKARKESTPC